MESVSEQTFVGLDVHRKSVTATAFDAAGSRVSQERLGATDAELIGYLDRLPGRKHVVLEACTLWEHFYDAAEATGASVVLSNPYKTRLIAEASLKTDKLDSEALATLLRLNSIPESYAPPPEVRALRNLVRERVFYRRKASSIKNHIYSVLLRRGIEYEDHLLNHRRKREVLTTSASKRSTEVWRPSPPLRRRASSSTKKFTTPGTSPRRPSCSARFPESGRSSRWRSPRSAARSSGSRTSTS